MQSMTECAWAGEHDPDTLHRAGFNHRDAFSVSQLQQTVLSIVDPERGDLNVFGIQELNLPDVSGLASHQHPKPIFSFLVCNQHDARFDRRLTDSRDDLLFLVIETQSVTRPLSRTEVDRSEEHTSELQSQSNLVCRLLL